MSRIRTKLHAIRTKSALIYMSIFVVLGVVLPGVAPFLTGTAAAAGSAVTMMYGGDINQTLQGGVSSGNKFVHKISCVGTFHQETIDNSLIQRAFGTSLDNLTSPLDKDIHDYIQSHLNKSLGVIEFTNASGSPYSDSCGSSGSPHFTLIPTGSDQWGGTQYTEVGQRHYMGFHLAGTTSGGKDSTGSLSYYTSAPWQGDKTKLAPQSQTKDVTIGGIPTATTGANSGSLSNATFKDAAHISADYTVGGKTFFETYTDFRWDARDYYFLTDTNEPDREKLTFSAQNENQSLDPRSNPGSSHTPFIWLSPNGTYNFDQKGSNSTIISNLQKGMNALASPSGTTAYFYDYNPDGSTVGGSNGTPAQTKISVNRQQALVWFYYSNSKKAFASVFQSGDGNENPYLGNYTLNTANNYYDFKGTDSCSYFGRIHITSQDPTLMGIDWQFAIANTQCQSIYGHVSVYAIPDEEAYNNAVNGLNTGNTTVNNNGGNAGQLTCDLDFNPLTWIVCPLMTAAQAGADQLNSAIDSMMNVDVNLYFNQNDNGTGAAFYKAWGSFRIIALAVVVIAGLVMVISQAAGWEIIDAYTIKKMMPRLVVAVIAIALSWQLCKEFVVFCDVLGFGVRNIIYAPFGGGGHFEIGSGTSSVLALIGAGGVLTLGIFATLSLALTAFLAVATGFVFLVLRLGLIFFLVIISPLAIACSILPNTQKLFKMWWGAFRDMGLAFAAISAAIALGRVLAYVNYRGNVAAGNTGVNGLKGLVLQLIAIVFYFGVYFIIPVIFRMIGGFIGTLSGFVNDRSRGAFDRLKQFRGNEAKKNLHKMKEGDRFGEGNVVARGFNRVTGGVGTGWKGRFGLAPGRYNAAMDIRKRHAAAEAAQNPLLQQMSFDDNAIAVLALSGGSKAGVRRAAERLQAVHGWTDDQRDRAVNTAQQVDVNAANALAAVSLMSQQKSRALSGVLAGDAGSALVRESVAEASGGNQQLIENTMGSFAYNSRNAGRFDLGGEMAGESAAAGWQRASVAQHATAFGASTQHYMNAFTDAIRNGDAGQKRSAAIALSEMQNALPYATEENRQIISQGLENIGVSHNSGISVEQQLANIASSLPAAGVIHGPDGQELHPQGPMVITPEDIRGTARQYSQNTPYNERGYREQMQQQQQSQQQQNQQNQGGNHP